MNLHLSHEQLCDLIFTETAAAPADDCDIVHEHLRACLICSAELKNLRDSLSLFRDASVSYARQEFAHYHARRHSILPAHRMYSQPLAWAAAVLIVVAALFPLSMRHQSATLPAASPAAQTAPVAAESDAALLADIDQEVSVEVPAPLEPLAASPAETTTTNSDQRKN